MADFIIPKGEDYYFKLKILAQNSIYPQSLKDMSSFTMKIFDRATGETVIPEDGGSIAYEHDNPEKLNGIINVHLTDLQTDLLTVNKSDSVDGYYLKAAYQASIKIEFSDLELFPIFSTVDEIFVSQTGN